MSMEKLIAMSNRYGADEEFVLAGGGNTSFKEGGRMYVKSSGTSLATITRQGFVAMDMEMLTAMLEKNYPQEDDAREAEALADMMAARLPGQDEKRPSVEAILHAIFPQRYVLHTHPPLLNGLSCSLGGAETCRRLLGDAALWVPLTKPGFILAQVCSRMLGQSQRQTGKFPSVVVLQNHGLFVAADSIEEIDKLMQWVTASLEQHVRQHPQWEEAPYDDTLAASIAPALRMLYGDGGPAFAMFFTNSLAAEMISDERAISELMAPLTPDHIVYCRHKPLFAAPNADYRAAFNLYQKENGFPPKIIAVKGLGFYALGKTCNEANTARLLFLDAIKVTVYARSFGGISPLPDDFTTFILQWEIESYRQKVALSPQNGRRLEGKIAIVTGGAQGFGRGIAEALVKEGAHVAVADLNRDGADDCARQLESAFGTGCAFPLLVNVADEASVEAMVRQTVLRYGGLDIFIANAGVLRAGSLEEMTKAQFDMVTAVNYTGYFLCAKYASAPMKIQHKYAPRYMSDIIEINSKSGLEGSNKNFAYAGGKFGGIGLTQSFALELVEYGIKVNAICPGNLLDGPLWSDPEKGLFRQYLDAGKVPGAKSIGDVRRHYEGKVPMKRGCTVADVVEAIFYLVAQKYETGQAVPVTGGQVMLK